MLTSQSVQQASKTMPSIFFSILKHFADGDLTPHAADLQEDSYQVGARIRGWRERRCAHRNRTNVFFFWNWTTVFQLWEECMLSPFSFSEMHEKCHFWTFCTRNSLASMLGSCHAFQCPFSTCQITSTPSLAHRSMWTYTYGRDKRGTNKCHPTWSK